MPDTNSPIDPFFNPKVQPTTPVPSPSKEISSKDVSPSAQPTTPPPASSSPTTTNTTKTINIDTLSTDVATNQLNSSPSTTPSTSQSSPKPQQSPTSQNTTTPPSPQQTQQILVKQGTKISFKTFAIWCGIFFWLFLLLVIVWLYIAISNPDSLANLGLDIGTVKSVLLIFTVLFFWILFFAWFGFAALNGYRLATVKEGSKVRYIVWFIVWLVVLLGAIGLWFISYSKINAISENQVFNSNDLILPYVQVKKFDDGEPWLSYSRIYIGTPWMPPLIAPTYMDMQMNRAIAENFGILNVSLTKLMINCGNGQTIETNPNDMNAQTLFFNGSCLYLRKWEYTVSMTYSYFDPQQAIEVTKTIEKAASITISTDFTFNVDGWDRKLNDNKNEIILGTAPSKILVDAQKIFTDLNIPNIQVGRDLDGNGTVDKQNRVSFTYYFDQPKLYTSYFTLPFTLPNGSPLWYLSRFRVNAWDVPPCELQTNRIGENNYELLVKVDDQWTDIEQYSIDIIDNQTDEIVKNLISDKPKFNFDFPNGRSYRVRGYFTTTESKRGSCEANTLLDIWYNSYNFVNTLSVLWPNDTTYTVMWNSGDRRVEWDRIIIDDLPTTIKLTINQIVPEIDNPQISVFENAVLKNPTKTREYVFKIDNVDWPKEIKLQLQDSKWKSATKVYTVSLERKNLMGKLLANKTVWFDPLSVEFDASITKLNDPTDEVVYFTWEFGDWEVRKNTSVGKITHIYKFDTVTENGEFQPKVTLKTRKWLTQTIAFPEKIIVKRQIKSFDILLPSHPAQLAKAGDVVDLIIQADGKITWVSRDFGNTKKLQWQGREFIETTMRYDTPWLYEIYATVEFSDHPPVTQSIKLKVE